MYSIISSASDRYPIMRSSILFGMVVLSGVAVKIYMFVQDKRFQAQQAAAAIPPSSPITATMAEGATAATIRAAHGAELR